MGNILKYKGYSAKIEYSVEDRCLFGVVIDVRDLIMFDAENSSGIETAFHGALDDYLTFCEEQGIGPDKQFSGNFNIRIPPEMHKKLFIKSEHDGKTLNACIREAIAAYIGSETDTPPSRRESRVQLNSGVVVGADGVATSDIVAISDYQVLKEN